MQSSSKKEEGQRLPLSNGRQLPVDASVGPGVAKGHQKRDFEHAPLVVFLFAAAALGNIFTLRRRLLSIEAMYRPSNAWTSHQARSGAEPGSARWLREEWARMERRREHLNRLWEEEMQRQQRAQRMFDREEAERERLRQAYAKWQRQFKYAGEGGPFSYFERKAQDRSLEHYQVLGLDGRSGRTFSVEEIKAAFRAKAMEYHPDRNPQRPEEAEAKFLEVMEAYQALQKQPLQ